MLQYLPVIGLYVNRYGSALKNIRSTNTVTGSYNVVAKWMETGLTGQYLTRRQWTAIKVAMQLYIFVFFCFDNTILLGMTLCLYTATNQKLTVLLHNPIQISD
jgi:hypothetical protein